MSYCFSNRVLVETNFEASKTLYFRGRHGGVEKGGGWKTSRMPPLPKRGFGPPPPTVRFPPPSGVSALFFLYKNPPQSRPEALLEGSKIFRESAFSGTFSSPHTFCTPPIHCPNICRHLRAAEITLTKARLLKHDLHFHGLALAKPLWAFSAWRALRLP